MTASCLWTVDCTWEGMDDPAKSLVYFHVILLNFTLLFPWHGSLHLLLLLTNVCCNYWWDPYGPFFLFHNFTASNSSFPVEAAWCSPTLTTVCFSASWHALFLSSWLALQCKLGIVRVFVCLIMGYSLVFREVLDASWILSAAHSC